MVIAGTNSFFPLLNIHQFRQVYHHGNLCCEQGMFRIRDQEV